MSEEDGSRIQILLEESDAEIADAYKKIMCRQLRTILPAEIFATGGGVEACEDRRARLEDALPLFTHSPLHDRVPSEVSFFLVNRYLRNSFKLFFEMISRWLVPGTRLNVVSFYAGDFRFPDFGPQVYTYCEVVIRIEKCSQLEAIRKQLPGVQTEICLGVSSSYYARRILEVKGLAADEKAAMIQEHIAYLIQRRPQDFDHDVFSEMQHVMVRCRDDFKAARESRHMSRIISVMYLFRKELRKRVQEYPDRRHLFVKLVRARLHSNEETSRVLGVLVGLNFLRRTEVFEERHILKAIRNFVASAEPVEGSFLFINRASETVGTLYLEVTKRDGVEFSLQEIQRLRRELPVDLRSRIEQLMHPVFMPRNEEEVMRNILSLAGQLKYLRDVPQVMITFDEQTATHLLFTVIWLRVCKAGDRPIQEMFLCANTSLGYLHDRCKTVGYLRRRHPKEATVFRVELPKERFLRGDHSIDLYRARRFVVGELTRVVGEFRDFNGGMISKQEELLGTVRGQLAEVGYYNDLLLENFFYSLSPVIMRSVLPPRPLKELFLMLVETLEEGFFRQGGDGVRMKRIPGFLLVVVTLKSAASKALLDGVTREKIPSTTDLATAFVTVHDTPSVGYIYRCEDSDRQGQFLELIEHTLHRGELCGGRL